MSSFTWLPFFDEMLSVICKNYDKTSLCKVFHTIFEGWGGVQDTFADGQKRPLEEIDPLTFITYFNRGMTFNNRVGFCEHAKRIFGLSSDIPKDLNGIPTMQNMNSWFFGWAKDRPKDRIEKLWDFGKAIDSLQVNDNMFQIALGFDGVGVSKLTVLMFICKPQHFISFDNTNEAYFHKKGWQPDLNIQREIGKSPNPYSRYSDFANDIRAFFENKPFYQLSYDAYCDREHSDKSEDKKPISSNSETKPRYWVIAPGEHARLWDDFRDKGIIAIGWSKLGDLSKYDRKETIRLEIQKLYGNETAKTNAALACYEFCKEINIGDYVFAKKGVSEIIGYGKVTSDYIYDSKRTEYYNTRKVEWLSVGSWQIPKEKDAGIPTKTLTDVTEHPNFLNAILNLIGGAGNLQTCTWIPFFKEMLSLICANYDKKSLCELFHIIFEDCGGVEDKFADGTSGPMREIDPLTFISYFNRKQNETDRYAFCQKAKDLLHISAPVPSDTYGLPTLLPHNALFFGYSTENAPDAIDNVWQFCRELDADAVTESSFNKVLDNRNVAISKLTQLTYICEPQKYMVLNSTVCQYFKSKGLNVSVHNFAEYIKSLDEIRSRFTGKSFPELVENAFDYVNNVEPKEKSKKIPEVDGEAVGETLAPKYEINDFVDETGFAQEAVENWQAQLLRKKQVVFYGPPGTGKTFVAERLAKLMISGTKGATEIVQFHPSYAYEDFIQGLRPQLYDGQLDYQMEPGRFLRFCSIVESRPKSPCVLIIDEINTAKLSSVFGELMYCLEYRDKPVQLAANGIMFKIPANLYLIGTMNTADRSIALVDHALRRRFYFIQLQPEYEILRSHLITKGHDADSLVNVLKEINHLIDDPNYELGISFFMSNHSNLKELLPAIWKGEVEPYLQELLYDQPQKVANFKWEKLVEDKLRVWAS